MIGPASESPLPIMKMPPSIEQQTLEALQNIESLLQTLVSMSQTVVITEAAPAPKAQEKPSGRKGR